MTAAASPEALRGRYLATFQFSWATASFMAPGLLTVLLSVGPALPWAVVGAMAILAGLTVIRLEPRLRPEAVRPSVRADSPETADEAR